MSEAEIHVANARSRAKEAIQKANRPPEPKLKDVVEAINALGDAILALDRRLQRLEADRNG
jgi:hypothetical protein